jgi:hypothetical protein
MADKNLSGENGAPFSDPNGELERSKALASQLADENARLKQDLRDLQIERDDFLRALRYYDPNGIFTAEDLAEYRKTAVSVEVVINELKERVRKAK